MIKVVIFDLDGVLVESRDMHYLALNKSLEALDEKYVIKKEEHLSTFDGLPTSTKLQKLTELKGLPLSLYDTVWEGKQNATLEIINKDYSPDFRIISILKRQIICYFIRRRYKFFRYSFPFHIRRPKFLYKF